MARYEQEIRFSSNSKTLLKDVQAISKSTSTLEAQAKKTSQSFKGLSNINLQAQIANFNSLADGLSSLAVPAANFRQNLAELSAITGVTGEGLGQLGDFARDSAKEFGLSAAGGVQSYKLLLSQLGPSLAQTPAQLKEMGDMVSITSKLMGNDAAAAAGVLTTAMNQYSVSIEDPIKATATMSNMMNVMAAAGQAGSAELPDIALALKNSGMAAKDAGVTFEELNATIQALDKAGKKGAEGGTAIRNVIGILGQGRFMPKEIAASLEAAGVSVKALGDKSTSLTDRMRVLLPVMGDSALISKLFGRENSNAAMGILQNVDSIDQLRTQITGTASAQVQAAKIMEGDIERNARIKATVDDFKISLNSVTGGSLTYASTLSEVGRTLINLTPLISIAKAVTAGFNIVLAANPIGAVVLAVAALAAGVYLAYQKFEPFRNLVDSLFGSIKMLGKAMLQVFRGDFSGAAATASAAFSNISTKSIKKETDKVEVVSQPIRATAAAGANVAPTVQQFGNLKKPATQTNVENDEGVKSIVSGGKKQIILTVNIEKVIGEVTQNVSEGLQSADDLVDRVLEGLTKSIHGTVRGVTGI